MAGQRVVFAVVDFPDADTLDQVIMSLPII